MGDAQGFVIIDNDFIRIARATVIPFVMCVDFVANNPTCNSTFFSEGLLKDLQS